MVGHRVVAALTAVALLSWELTASAQCKADVDCKGDRVCERGQCVDPRTKQPDEPPPPPAKKDDDVKVTISDVGEPANEDYDTGWALAAGIIAFIGAAAAIGLSIPSELTKEDQIPSIPLGVAATVLVAAIGPVAVVGGGSARRAAGATGLKGLRIAGWVAYGVSLATALALIYLGVLDVEPPTGLITATGAIGALSLVFFGIDDFASHNEAAQGAISQGPSFLPTIVLSKSSDGSAIPGLGIAASF